MKRALITGVTGQDGYYLSQHLLGLGYDVYGLVRRTSAPARVPHGVHAVDGDVTDFVSLGTALRVSRPDEVYNLAAQSFVETSFKAPLLTAQVNGIGAHNVFEAVRQCCPEVRIYQASTSEQYGGQNGALHERSPFNPRSPYASAKVYAHHTAANYRRSYGMFIACGILFNHESPRRGPEFVTQKIAQAVARIHLGDQTPLVLGNLSPSRDWGYAGDYVKAMHLMLQAPTPDDFVIGTGESHSVREFAAAAFAHVGLDYLDYVTLDPAYASRRPDEVFHLRANNEKAEVVLGWEPEMSFATLVRLMVDAAVGEVAT